MEFQHFNTSDIGTPEPFIKDPSYDNIVRITILTVGFIGVLNNGLVFVVVAYVRNLRTMANFFVVSQAAIDFFSSLCLILQHIIPVTTIPQGTAGDVVCRLWVSRFLMYGCFNASTFNLVTLTLDRYFAIVYPFQYVAKFNKTKAVAILVTSNSLVFLFSSYPIVMLKASGGYCIRIFMGSGGQKFFGVAVFIMQYLLPVSIMMFAYTHMGLSLKSKGIVPSQPSFNDNHATLLRARRNIYKMLCLVFSAFILCWTPNQVYFLIYNLYDGMMLNMTFMNFTIILVYCNCCINPILYAMKYKQFRGGLKQVCCCHNNIGVEIPITA
ncbi:galanin receptor 2b-like [Saccoglossus kowalevskii]